jgi:hypothetical protein
MLIAIEKKKVEISHEFKFDIEYIASTLKN